MPRLVAFSDSHLGQRKYDRLLKSGLNAHEAAVASTFTRTVDRIIERAPDIVLYGGDLFDAAKPPNAAVIHAFSQFQRLRQALPETPIILASGNHDRARASETGCILPLFRQIGVHVAIASPARFRFGDVSVLAVPELPKLPTLIPDDARYPVLLLHGEIAGVLKGQRLTTHTTKAPGAAIPIEDLHAPEWRAVLLGHYHQHHEVAPNAWYCGSTDYTSSDVWSEIATPKGFIEVDLESGEKRFHEVAPERRHYDCEPIQANGLGADELTRLIGERLESVPGGIDGAVVRLKVMDCPSTVAKALDHGAIRKWKARALFLRLDIRKPVRDVSVIATMPKKTASLEELLRWRLEQQELPADVDRGELVRLGQHYMDKALESKEPKQEAPANAAA